MNKREQEGVIHIRRFPNGGERGRGGEVSELVVDSNCVLAKTLSVKERCVGEAGKSQRGGDRLPEGGSLSVCLKWADVVASKKGRGKQQ